MNIHPMLWSLVGARMIFTPAYWVFHPRTPDTCANIPPGVEAWVGDFEAQVIADKGVALQYALSNHWDSTEVTLHHLLITTSPMTHTTSTYSEYCSLSRTKLSGCCLKTETLQSIWLPWNPLILLESFKMHASLSSCSPCTGRIHCSLRWKIANCKHM